MVPVSDRGSKCKKNRPKQMALGISAAALTCQVFGLPPKVWATDASTVIFNKVTGADNPFNGVDVGNNAKPAFVDIDGDGDFDAFIGEGMGDILYFQNTGDPSNPQFAAPVANPFNLQNIDPEVAPTLTDIDNDGDVDAFTGCKGAANTDIHFFINNGNAQNPSFGPAQTAPFGLPSYPNIEEVVPFFTDINSDGLFDAFIGMKMGGGLNYYPNNGTQDTPAFGPEQNNPFGFQPVGWNCTPQFVDIDLDADYDLFSGQDHLGGSPPPADILYFENTGDRYNPAFGAKQTNPFGLEAVSNNSAPAFVDIDGDNDQDLFVGDGDGIITFFRNDSMTVTVETAGAGTGKVASSPAGIDCPGDCGEIYDVGTTVTLSAAPDPGSAFDGWTKDNALSPADSTEPTCVGNGTCTLTMDQSHKVTATFNPDSDGDGISDLIENNGPNSGDGNNDGLPDAEQNNVATFQDIYGNWITLVSEDGTTLHQVTATTNPSPADQPAVNSFTNGFFSFKVAGLDPEAETTLSMILHNQDQNINTFYKHGPTPDNNTPHWYDFNLAGSTGAKIEHADGQTIIELHFKDGQRGDDDLTANGEIIDDGAPADIDNPGGGGSGGSCFIQSLR